MRVIGGQAKGRRLVCPRGLETRPAQDKLREAVFNILAEVVEGSFVLDLFAGSGALGIEALSRGARGCVFVERDLKAILAIKTNLESTRLAPMGVVIRRDVLKCLPELQKRGVQFGLIFIDPPYTLWERPRERQALLDFISAFSVEKSLLEPHAIVVLRYRSHKVELPEHLGEFHLFDRRVYGDTTLTFWSTNKGN
jgi:16S rRNA (guanine(966)-N(2))-methyltransferase RsmD